MWENGTVQQTNYTEPKAPGKGISACWSDLSLTQTVYLINGAAGHYDGLDTVATPYPGYVA